MGPSSRGPADLIRGDVAIRRNQDDRHSPGSPRRQSPSKTGVFDTLRRLGELFVLAPAKTMARHGDGRAEPRLFRIERGDRPAGLRQQELWRDCRAIGVEVAFGLRPVEPIEMDVRNDDASGRKPPGRPSWLDLHPTSTRFRHPDYVLTLHATPLVFLPATTRTRFIPANSACTSCANLR